MHVIIPAGALDWECDGDVCFYSASFEVFDETGNKVIARGTATGRMVITDEEEDEVEVENMDVHMPIFDVKRLKRFVEKLKRHFS